MTEPRFWNIFSNGILRPEARQDDPYSIANKLNKKIEEINTSREFKTYWERTSEDFKWIWDTIKEDVELTSADISNKPVWFKNLFTKTTPTATWVATRGIISPISAWFSWLFSGKEWDKTLLTEWLKWVWATFEWIEKWFSAVWKWIWLEDRYAWLFWEWVTNIATWVIWEAWIWKAFWSVTKANRLKAFEQKKVLVEQELLQNIDLETIWFNQAMSKTYKIEEAQKVFNDYHTKLEDWTLTINDVKTTKKQLSNLWLKDTSYFTERFNDLFSTSTIKEKATTKVKADTAKIIENNKLLEFYYKPEKAPENIKKVIDDLKKIEDLWLFKVKWINTFNIPKASIIKTWWKKLSKLFNGDTKTINQALDFRERIFKESDEFKLSELWTDNEVKKEIWDVWKDTQSNPFKMKNLDELTANWLLKETIDNKWQYSYKLTSKWEQISKKLWFTESQIDYVKKTWLAHHMVEDMDKYRLDRFEFPSLLDNKDIQLMNRLYNIDWVDFNWFNKIIRRVNTEQKLWLDKKIVDAKNIDDLKKIANTINDKIANQFIDVAVMKKVKLKNLNSASYLLKWMPEQISERIIKKTWWFTIEKKTIIEGYTKKLNDLKAKYKWQWDKLRLAIKNEIDKKNKALFQLRMKYNKIWEIRAERINEIKLLKAWGKLLWDINSVIAKRTRTKEWNKMVTPSQIKAQFDKLDNEIAIAHIKWLQEKISKSLASIIKREVWTSKTYRVWHTPEVEEMLYQIKELFNANKAWYNNIDELTSLLETIRDLKSRSRDIAKDERIFQSNRNTNNINQIVEEWITDLTWSKYLPDDKTSTDRIKWWMWDWEKASTFTYNTFWKIFWHAQEWKMSKWLEIFNANPVRALNQMNVWIEKNVHPLAETIKDVLGKEQNDWWIAMFARRTDNMKENPYIGLDRIHNSKNLKEKYLVKRESSIWAKPEWISDIEWDRISNTKLWELLERMETDLNWKTARLEWNTFHKELFKKYKVIVEKYDWILLKEDNDYFTMMADWYRQDIEMWKFNFMDKSMTNKSAHWTADTVEWAWIDYEINPTKVLLYWNHSTFHQIFLRDAFEEMNQAWIWKQYQFKVLTPNQRHKLLSQTDKDWNILYELKDKMWNTIDEVDWLSDLELEQIYITSKKWWVRSMVWKETRDYIDEWIKKIAMWGSYKLTWTERFVSKIINQITANTLAFSPSPVFQQWLSLIDWASILWSRRMMSTISLIMANPELINLAERASFSVKARKWDNFIFAEVLQKSFDDNVIWKWKEIIRKHNEIWLYPMRYVDEKVYATIWITSFIENLEKRWIKFKSVFNDEEAIMYADTMADRIAWTTSKVNVPPIFDNLVWQLAFKLWTTVMNRWQTAKYASIKAFWDWDNIRWTKIVTWYFVWWMAQIIVAWVVAKAMYSLGLSAFNPEKDATLMEQLFSLEAIYQSSLGQSPIWGKFTSALNFNSLTILDNAERKAIQALKDVKEWKLIYDYDDKELKWFADFFKIFLWWKVLPAIENLNKVNE